MTTRTQMDRLSATSEDGRSHKGSRLVDIVLGIAGIGAFLVSLTIVMADLSEESVGILVVVLMLLMMAMAIPIGIAMIVASALGVYALSGLRGLEGAVQQSVFDSVASWELSVIPMFILMGIAMWKGGLTAKAFAAAHQWFGRLPGGLAIATNFAGAGLAAGSGSSIGISYAVGRIAVPEMLRAGYQPALVTGTVATAGTLGQLIPPSVMLVLYAGVAQTPVGPQLAAAAVPGVLLAVAYGGLIVIRAAVNPAIAPRGGVEGITWKSRFIALWGVVPIAVIVLIVIGGLFAGLFTATEAGAWGALAAIVLSIATLGKGKRDLKAIARFLLETIRTTVTSTAAIFLLVIGVNLLSLAVSLTGVAQGLTDLVLGANLDQLTFLLLLIVVYLILGMFLDPLAMMLLTVPLLLTPLTELGVDPIWFGVFIVMLAEIGIVTPPVGILSFIVHQLVQDPEVNLGNRISLTTVFKGVLPFVVVALLMLLLFVFFPQLVLWLPGLTAAS